MPESDVRTALATGDMGFLHSFTTGSTVDGPGVRVVAWTAGCMWRCLYCHNPDTWTMTNGIPVTLARATEELAKYRHGLKVMARRLHPERGRGAHAGPLRGEALRGRPGDGNPHRPRHERLLRHRLSDAELDTIDLVLLDVKGWDPERHRRLTGMDIGPTLDFARRLAARGKPIWLRFVLVPGLTDDPEDVAGIADFAAGLGNVRARRRPPVPPDGPVQVEGAGPRVPAR